MKKAMRWLVLTLFCVVGCLAERAAVSVVASGAKEAEVTFQQFQMEQVKKYREFVSSLRKEQLSPEEMQKRTKEYAKNKLLKAFLDYKKTKEGAKVADDIDRELIVISIQVARDDSFADRILRSEKDPKRSLELKLFAAEQYGRVRNSEKARELVNAVLEESKAKFPEVHKQAGTVLFRVAPEGLAFPEFQEGTKDMEGKALRVADYKGKIVLVDFWATWCGPCLTEIPNLVKAYRKYHDKGFEIVGISFDQSKEKLLKLTKEEKMTWRQYFDGLGWGNKVGKAYGIRAIPAMYLVGKNGKVISNNVRGGTLEEVLAKELGAEKK